MDDAPLNVDHLTPRSCLYEAKMRRCLVNGPAAPFQSPTINIVRDLRICNVHKLTLHDF